MADSLAAIAAAVTSAQGTAPSTGAGVSFSSATDKTTLAGNFNTFLTILTTQLKNQNPLDPMDTNQFTQQLVQFTGVEQQLKSNTYLEALMNASQRSTNTDAVSYIGKEVTASGTSATLKGGGASWSYNAAANASDA